MMLSVAVLVEVASTDGAEPISVILAAGVPTPKAELSGAKR